MPERQRSVDREPREPVTTTPFTPPGALPGTPANDNDDRLCAEMLRAMAELRPVARRWASDVASAEDLWQDTAERALRSARTFEPGTNAAAWVRTIMYRLAIDETRRRQRQRALTVEYGSFHPAWSAPLQEADEGRDPEPPSDLAEVCRAADRLTPKLRAAFRLWAVDRLSYREIARELDIPVNTVASRLLRARLELRGDRPAAARQFRSGGGRPGPR